MIHCHFYVREAVGDQWRYDRVLVASPEGDSSLHTDTPPVVGDLIVLSDQSRKLEGWPGQCRVIERAWMYSSWGSTNWPYGEAQSRVGPTLDLIVERAEGPFVNEAPVEDEDDG